VEHKRWKVHEIFGLDPRSALQASVYEHSVIECKCIRQSDEASLIISSESDFRSFLCCRDCSIRGRNRPHVIQVVIGKLGCCAYGGEGGSCVEDDLSAEHEKRTLFLCLRAGLRAKFVKKGIPR